MFHYPSHPYSHQQSQRRFATPSSFYTQQQPSLLSTYDATPASYDEYDASRIAEERRLLALKQQRRREAEEEALLARAAAKRRQEINEAYLQLQVEQEQRRREAAVAEHQAALRRAQFVDQQKREQARRAYLARQIEQRRREEEAVEDAFNPFEFLSTLLASSSIAPPTTSTTVSRPSAPAPVQSTSTSQPRPRPAAEKRFPFELFFEFGAPSSAPAPSTSTSTSAPVAPTPAPRQPSPVDNSAAETLQRHYRAHLHRRQQLSTISTLSTSFESHKSSFTLPESLVYVSDPNSAPKLAYSAVNAPVLAYEDFLVGLLSKVDEVQSGGDRLVKAARKELVKKVEEELKKLDEKKELDLKAFVEAHSVEEVATEVVEEPVITSTEPTTPAEDTLDLDYIPPLFDETLTSTAVTESSPSAEPVESHVVDTPSELAADPTPVEIPADPTPVETAAGPTPVIETESASPTPLTADSLASVPSSPLVKDSAKDVDSDSSSTTSRTISTLGDVDFEHVLEEAKKLGVKVDELEVGDRKVNAGEKNVKAESSGDEEDGFYVV